jgi:4-hydroxy-tetrahydrodipicolinate reductase
VILAGPGESLTFTHDTVEPALAYAPGIRLAVPYAAQARGVVVGLESMIDLGIRS